MTSHFTSRTLFEELDGRTYPTYRELERQVRGLFSSHIEKFPGQYSVDRLLELGERNKWIIRRPDGNYEIQFRKGAGRVKRIVA